MHEAAAVITYLAPGLRFVHQGQLEGRRKRISPHLVRRPLEPADETLRRFYDGLLAVLRRPIVRDGRWRLLECAPAWDGNWTCDCFIAGAWEGADGQHLVVAVNYAGNQRQCYVRLAPPGEPDRTVVLQDLMSPTGTIAPGATSRRAVFTSTWRPGATTSSR